MKLKALCLLSICFAVAVSCCNKPNQSYSGKMVYIPAGNFLMGSKGSSDNDEGPSHSVYLSDYYIGKYEVTRGEYRKFMEAGGYSTRAYWSEKGWEWKESNKRTQPDYWEAKQTWKKDQSFEQTDNHPVIGVGYYEAEAFCNWAGGHLPTEAQWEKAASWDAAKRHANVYPWGDVGDDDKCNNYADHSEAGGGYANWETAPVGSFPAGTSSYGCLDIAGNAKEWCKDWYESAYYSQPPKRGWKDPRGPSIGYARAVRGGGWDFYDYSYSFRCASRDSYYPDSSSYGYLYGFRFAR